MGIPAHLAVTVRSLSFKDAPAFTANFRIDTTTWNSMAPASALRQIGIEAFGKRIFQLPNAELEEFEYAFAQITLMDEITTDRILFGPENTEPTIGKMALQSAGLFIDPVTDTLKKLPARPLKTVVLPKIPLAA